MKSHLIAMAVGLGISCSVCSATSFLELQSTYLGDGWFKYRMKVLPDPFFAQVDIGGLGVTFTNFAEYGPEPPGWTNGAIDALWSYALSIPQVRPYEREFLVRSSEQTYRWDPYGAIVLMSLYLSEFAGVDWGGLVSQNIAGYARFPALVPCRPEEADGSAPDRTSVLKLVPDIEISALLVTNGAAYGLTFEWGWKSTVLLQGSRDNRAWTNISYILGEPGTTLWTTNEPLTGEFFRVQLVSGGHLTNPPPLSLSGNAHPARASLQKNAPGVSDLTCQPEGTQVRVQFSSEPGTDYVVEARDLQGNVISSKTVTGDWRDSVVFFESVHLPPAVFFTATPRH